MIITPYKNNIFSSRKAEIDQYLQLNGSTEYLKEDSSIVSAIISNNPTSISIDMKIDDWSGYTQGMSIAMGDTNGNEFFYVWVANNLKLQAAMRNSTEVKWTKVTTNDLQTDYGFIDSEWFTISIEDIGTSPVLKVNGNTPAQSFSDNTDITFDWSNLTNCDNFRLGCINWNSGGNSSFFAGGLDNLTIGSLATFNFNNSQGIAASQFRFYDNSNTYYLDTVGF